ncbi:flavin reductase family protein [Chryseobacterium sp. A301]
MKTIDPKDLSSQDLQTLMQTAIAPRPIALASTINKKGEPNLSPFSFFNMVSTVPPILVFSPSRRVRDNTTKHTLENIIETNEVVIGIVNYDIVQQVSLSSTEYEEGVNEFVKAGFTMMEGVKVKPKLIAECPVNFECRVLIVQSLGSEGGSGNLVICQVEHIHIDPKYLDSKGRLDQMKLDLVSRLGGPYYGRNNEANLFKVPKPLTKKGIGFDNLPKVILTSTVLTGNDLALLANVETVPEGHFSADKEIHLKAQALLLEGEVEQAWKTLGRPTTDEDQKLDILRHIFSIIKK